MLNRQTPCAYACLHTQRTCLLVHAYMLACACVHADSRPSSGCMGHGTHSKMAFTYTDTLSASGPCTHKVHARIQRYTCTLSPHICQAALELAMRKSSASNGTNGSTPPPVNKLPPPPGGHYCRGHKEHCLCHKEHCLGRNEHGFKHCLSWGLIWHGRPSYFCVTNRECGQGVPISCGQGRPSPRNQARRSQVFPPGLNNSRGERKPATPLGLVPYAWLSGSNLQQQTVRSKALTPAL